MLDIRIPGTSLQSRVSSLDYDYEHEYDYEHDYEPGDSGTEAFS